MSSVSMHASISIDNGPRRALVAWPCICICTRLIANSFYAYDWVRIEMRHSDKLVELRYWREKVINT